MTLGQHLLHKNDEPAKGLCPYTNDQIGQMMLKLGQRVSDVNLYPYQVPLALRIFDSLLYYDPKYPTRSGDGNTITALFSRQCVAPETLILTPKGYTPMRNLAVGDEVTTVRDGKFVNDKIISKWGSAIPLYKITLSNGMSIHAGGQHRFKLVNQEWSSVSEGLVPGNKIEVALSYPTEGHFSNEHTLTLDTDESDAIILALILQFATKTTSKALKNIRKHDKVFCYINDMEYAKEIAKRFDLPIDIAAQGVRLTLDIDLDSVDLNLIYKHKYLVLKHLFRNASISPYMGNRFRKYRVFFSPTSNDKYQEALLLFLRTVGLFPVPNPKQRWIEFTDYQSFYIIEPFIRHSPHHPRIQEYLCQHVSKQGHHFAAPQYNRFIRTYRGLNGQYTRALHWHYRHNSVIGHVLQNHIVNAGFVRPHCYVDFPSSAYLEIKSITLDETVQEAYDIETEIYNTYIANGILTHNSGKTETVAVTVMACMIWLPQFALEFPNDQRFKKFRKGFWAGIFAPILDQADTMFSRIKERLTSATGEAILSEFELEARPKGRQLSLTNGSFAFCKPAGEGVNIESKTLHLAIGDESQDISSKKIRKSINPMVAATGGTKLFIGTANTIKSYYYEKIMQNIDRELKGGKKNHFQADYEEVLKWNSYYEMSVEEDKESMGFDSDEFKMSYRCLFIFERGMMCDPILLTPWHPTENTRGMFYDYEAIDSYYGHEYVSIGLDLGKMSDSTVATAYAVDVGSPIEHRAFRAYRKRILGWMDLIGDDFEAQFEQIYHFIAKMRGQTIVVDATGKGEPMYDKLNLALPHAEVIPFIFSQKSKHLLFKNFISDLSAGRIMVPYGVATRQSFTFRKFVQQMGSMEKEYKGEYMSCHAPNVKGAHDDYPVSAALGAWAAKEERLAICEEVDNPFFGDAA